VFLDVLTVPLFPQGSYLDVIFVIPCVPPQSYDLILDLRLPVQMRSPLVVLELSIMLPFLYLCFPLLLSCILSILVIMYRLSLLIHTHIHHVLFRCWFPIRWAERNNLFVSHQNLSRPLNHDADVISERGVSACACGCSKIHTPRGHSFIYVENGRHSQLFLASILRLTCTLERGGCSHLDLRLATKLALDLKTMD